MNEAGSSLATAWAQGYAAKRLDMEHSDGCDAVQGDWVGEMCDRSPRLCDCWCHIGQSPDWLTRHL